MKYTCSMETVQQNGRFTLFSSKFHCNIYSILFVNIPQINRLNARGIFLQKIPNLSILMSLCWFILETSFSISPCGGRGVLFVQILYPCLLLPRNKQWVLVLQDASDVNESWPKNKVVQFIFKNLQFFLWWNKTSRIQLHGYSSFTVEQN